MYERLKTRQHASTPTLRRSWGRPIHGTHHEVEEDEVVSVGAEIMRYCWIGDSVAYVRPRVCVGECIALHLHGVEDGLAGGGSA